MRESEDVDRGGARPRRRACARLGALPRRRQQPRVPRVLRAPGGAADDRRAADERAPRIHQHALQAALGLPAARRRRGLGHAAGAPQGDRRRVQGRAAADAGSPARAVPALPADRRGLRLPEPRVRGVGGRRRDRDARDARRRGGHQDLRRLDRSRRVPARLRERLPDDDATRRRGRAGLHARARRGAIRHPAAPDPGLHRPEGRHERQHPGHPRHRGQDGGAADRAVRLARGRRRARCGALARAIEGDRRERRAGASLEAPGDDAARSRPRRRSCRARPAASRPLRAQGDLPAVRVPRAARARRHARRGAARGRASRDRVGDRVLARRRPAGTSRPRRRRRRCGARRRCGRNGRGDPHTGAAAASLGPRRRRARREGAAAGRACRGRHDDPRVPDRSGPRRVRARRSHGRVRRRARARPARRGGDGCARAARRSGMPSRRAARREGRRARLRTACIATSSFR